MRSTVSMLALLLCLPALACSDAPGTSATAPASATDDPATTGAATTGGTATTGDAPATDATSATDPQPGTSGETTAVDPDPTTGEVGDDTTGGSTDAGSSSGGADDSSSGDGGAAEELPPVDTVEALEAWLAGGAYKQWAVESQVHASTGPHGGNVRTWVNKVALDSLEAGDAEHPKDAATVKELYGNGFDTPIGYAVSLKTQPQSEGGATWYWYERVNDTTYASSLDVPLCTGCHGGGADYILTPYPLQ